MLKKENGFTLVEMLIVMLIISILLILIIPNLTEQSKNVDEKGCEALVSMVQAQSDAYYLDNNKYANSIDDLATDGYIEENQKQCNDHTPLFSITNEGKVLANPDDE